MPTKVMIEIQSGSYLKTEIKDGKLIVDRVLDTVYPCAYGFVPDTLAKDNDPLDAFVIGDYLRPTTPVVAKQLLGAFICYDNGILDEKLVFSEKNILGFTDVHIYFIKRFLKSYKKGFVVKKWVGPKEAANLIKKYTVKKAQRKITLKDIHPI